MPRPKNKREVLELFENNPDYKAQARAALEQPWMQAWLDAVLVNMGPYSVDTPFNQLPHIQDRIDGGKAAVNHFLHRLVTLPYRETLNQEADDEYVGFDTSSSIQTATKAIKK